GTGLAECAGRHIMPVGCDDTVLELDIHLDHGATDAANLSSAGIRSGQPTGLRRIARQFKNPVRIELAQRHNRKILLLVPIVLPFYIGCRQQSVTAFNLLDRSRSITPPYNKADCNAPKEPARWMSAPSQFPLRP